MAIAGIDEIEGRMEESVRRLERAVKLDPGLAAAHYKLGLLYQRRGEQELARNELRLFQDLKADSRIRDRNAVLHSLAR